MGLFDDNPSISDLLGIPCLGAQKEAIDNAEMIVSIGDNKLRKLVSSRFNNRYGKALHPSAVV